MSGSFRSSANRATGPYGSYRKTASTPFQAFPCTATPDGVTPSSVASFDFTKLRGRDRNLCIHDRRRAKPSHRGRQRREQRQGLESHNRQAPAHDRASLLCNRRDAERRAAVLRHDGRGDPLPGRLSGRRRDLEFRRAGERGDLAFQQLSKRSPTIKTISSLLAWNYTPIDAAPARIRASFRAFSRSRSRPGSRNRSRSGRRVKYRTVPILNRIYGDMGEATGERRCLCSPHPIRRSERSRASRR